MRVILQAEVFEAPPEQAQLVTLFNLGLCGRHHLQTEPIDSPQLQGWLRSLPEQLRAECEFALELGAREQVHVPSDYEIRVARVHAPAWAEPQPVLPLQVALELLQQPFCILFEDNLNDRDFLLSVAQDEIREQLSSMAQRHWIVYEHGGGNGGMRVRIDEKAASRAHQLRTWALFDSDALQPGQPSRDALRLRDACGNVIPFHCLQRRAIENYLPIQALERWAAGNGERSRRINALRRLSRDQHHHFNMKRGFASDEPRAGEAGNLFDGLELHTRNALRAGIDADIADLFDPRHSPDPARSPLPDWWLQIDGQTAETRPMLDRLLRLF